MVVETLGRENQGVPAPEVVDKGEDAGDNAPHSGCQVAVIRPVRQVAGKPQAHSYPARANQKAHAEFLGDAETFFRAQHVDIFGHVRFRGSIADLSAGIYGCNFDFTMRGIPIVLDRLYEIALFHSRR